MLMISTLKRIKEITKCFKKKNKWKSPLFEDALDPCRYVLEGIESNESYQDDLQNLLKGLI